MRFVFLTLKTPRKRSLFKSASCHKKTCKLRRKFANLPSALGVMSSAKIRILFVRLSYMTTYINQKTHSINKTSDFLHTKLLSFCSWRQKLGEHSKKRFCGLNISKRHAAHAKLSAQRCLRCAPKYSLEEREKPSRSMRKRRKTSANRDFRENAQKRRGIQWESSNSTEKTEYGRESETNCVQKPVFRCSVKAIAFYRPILQNLCRKWTWMQFIG